MDLTITMKGASEAFAREVIALFASAEGVIVSSEPLDTKWTAERAYRLLRMSNARATTLLLAAVDGNGWVDGADFRAKHGENALHGPTAAISKAITRGSREGHWSANIPHPLSPTPPHPTKGWSKTGGYFLEESHLPAFQAAVARFRAEDMNTAVAGAPAMQADPADLPSP